MRGRYLRRFPLACPRSRRIRDPVVSDIPVEDVMSFSAGNGIRVAGSRIHHPRRQSGGRREGSSASEVGSSECIAIAIVVTVGEGNCHACCFNIRAPEQRAVSNLREHVYKSLYCTDGTKESSQFIHKYPYLTLLKNPFLFNKIQLE